MFSRKPKIGFDISPLSFSNNGISRYVKEILKLTLDQRYEWFLYSNRAINLPELNRANIHQKIINIPQWIPRLVWFHFILPIQIYNDKLDIFWSPAHRLPLISNKNLLSILTIHDLVWKYHPKTMKLIGRIHEKIVMPRSIRNADKILSISNSTTLDLEKTFTGISGKILTTPLGVNLPAVPPNARRIIECSYFLFVGTVEPRKNLGRLIQAFGKFCVNHPGKIKFVIVGNNGWGKINLKNLLLRSGVQNETILLEAVSDQELAVLYRNARFTAMPSLYEGFGLPLLESINSNTPVLTSNNSAMVEVAKSAGCFIDPYDIDSIFDGIRRLTLDNQLYAKLKNECELIKSLYDWDFTRASTLQAIDEVLQKIAGAPHDIPN